jgi:hypothetical protein
MYSGEYDTCDVRVTSQVSVIKKLKKKKNDYNILQIFDLLKIVVQCEGTKL